MDLRLMTAALLLALGAAPAPGQDAPPDGAQASAPAKLNLGDAAPALAIERWVRGEPVNALEKGRVYLIQFWAPWSRTSLEQMALLTNLQKSYGERGLTVFAVASADISGTTLEQVQAKVDQNADTIGVPVAWDRGTSTKDAFLKAAGRTTLPSAVLVDREGRVVFVEGAPRVGLHLEAVLAGEHDLKALAAWHAKAARAPQTERALDEAVKAQKWAEVVASSEELLEVDPTQYHLHAPTRFHAQALGLDELDEAYAWAQAFVAGPARDSAQALNAVAWAVVDPTQPVPRRDLELALGAAQRAADLTKEQDGAILDTLARVRFLKGEVREALRLQRKALEKLTPAFEPYRGQLEERLKEYEAALEKQGAPR